MSSARPPDLRTWIAQIEGAGELQRVNGAHWNLEIGALIESAAELITPPPMLLFDEIKGYPRGFRVAALLFASYRRVALALGLPHDKSKLELVRLASRKILPATMTSVKQICPHVWLHWITGTI